MAKPITARLDVTKILKEHLYEGKEYQGKKPKYLNLVIWPNKNGPGKFNDAHFACQEVSKEARDQGIKGPILGSVTVPQEEATRPQQEPRSKSSDAWDRVVNDDTDPPF